MDLKTFFEHFDTLAEAPNGIQRLRELILDMAVRGKLVPQDPEDELAEKLLQKTIYERLKNAEKREQKKIKDLPRIELNEAPFNLPLGWCWARFPELGKFGRGKSKHRPRNEPELYKDGYYPLVQTGDVARSKGFIHTHTALYNEKGLAQSLLWEKGTLCITIAANIADSGILAFPACTPDSVVGFIPSNVIGDARYFEYFMRTAKNSLLEYAPSTAQKNINLAILEKVLIPLPPLAEQKRIVAKVDELMALCDALEAAQHTRNTLRQSLRASALDTLMNATNDTALDTAWSFVCDHWVYLSHHPKDVAGLRKVILTLAVHGRLVRQNSEEESATTAINRIQTLRLKSGKKYPKLAISNLDDGLPKLPYLWVWSKLGSIANVCLGGTPSRKEPKYWDSGSIPWVSSGEVANCKIHSTKELITEDGLANSNAKIYPKDTVLIAIIGQGKTRGQSAILNIEACTNQNIVGLVFDMGNVYPEYVWKWALSIYESARSEGRGGAQPALNCQKVRDLCIPLPPLAEQKRIVAKVDELMQLCDQLEENLRQQHQQATALVASTISHLAA